MSCNIHCEKFDSTQTMAEIATGAGIALAAEEVLSTTLQAGVATYFFAKPTQPLKATFIRIAVAHDNDMHRYVSHS